jgi:sugar lactone lactonase YvrE
MAIDAKGDLYVSNCGTDCAWGPPGPPSIEEFIAGSGGNAKPVRLITGSRTRLSGNVNGLAVDRSGFIYVALAGPNSVNVYSPHATGDVGPDHILSESRTQIDNPDGIAVGRRGLYVTSSYKGIIELFPRKARGNNSPVAKVHASWSNDGQQIVGGVAVADGDSLFVTGFSVPLVAGYSARGGNHRTPVTMITGRNTGLVLPTFVFVR